MANQTQRLWMVRAGEGSVRASEFERASCVAIGWPEAGDFTTLSTPESLRARIDAAYPNDSTAARNLDFSQTNRFRNVMRPGDRVVTYNSAAREFLVGTITGDYEYRPHVIPGFSHVRSVRWDGRVPKGALRKTSLNSLGAILTVFQPGDHVISDLDDALQTDRTISPDEAQTEQEDLPSIFKQFVSEYLSQEAGKKHAAQYLEARRVGKQNYEQIRSRVARGDDVTDAVLTKLLPHTNSKWHRDRQDWIHVAPAITRDVKSWYEGAGWATPESWPSKARLILTFVEAMGDEEADLERVCADFAASAFSKGLQSGMLTPILNALHPARFTIVNSKVVKTFEAITGDQLHPAIAQYPNANARIRAFVDSNASVFEQGQNFDVSPLDAFDMLCHWYVAVREDDNTDDGGDDEPVEKLKGRAAIDRQSATGARRIVEKICPDGAPRATALAHLARSIQLVSELAPNGWSVTLKERVVRLNIGGMMALDLDSYGLYLVVLEPELSEAARQQVSELSNDEFNYLPGVEGYRIPYAKLDPVVNLARPAHDAFLQRAAEKSDKAPFKKAHSPGVLRLLRELGHDVQDPAYSRNIASVVREPDPRPKVIGGERTAPAAKHPAYSTADAGAETNVSPHMLESWIRAINRKGQAILYGPPGTGKSFLAERLARILLSGGDGHQDFVQFHPSFAYEDFIQGLRPQSRDDGGLTYSTVAGRFMEFCTIAAKRSGTSVLIIDEINRANLSSVFGELMYLLEYRDRSLPLAGGGRLTIPPTVRIIGTMNTADRSIALVDHALRRRFAFIRLDPDLDLLSRYHEMRDSDVSGLVAVLQQLNARIADPHYSVGISFFMRDNLADDLEAIWVGEIEPYIEELFFDRKVEVDRFRWSEIKDRVAVALGT